MIKLQTPPLPLPLKGGEWLSRSVKGGEQLSCLLEGLSRSVKGGEQLSCLLEGLSRSVKGGEQLSCLLEWLSRSERAWVSVGTPLPSRGGAGVGSVNLSFS
ncbi:MAG: hypothetical protein IJ546_00135 [Prevotella sp.]|nr:hypothetical protein [Prevotella sp.]